MESEQEDTIERVENQQEQQDQYQQQADDQIQIDNNNNEDNNEQQQIDVNSQGNITNLNSNGGDEDQQHEQQEQEHEGENHNENNGQIINDEDNEQNGGGDGGGDDGGGDDDVQEYDETMNDNEGQQQKPTKTITISKFDTTQSIASVMPAIGRRLNVQIDQLEARITADKYDTEAWTLLLNEVQSQPITIARDIYERFLAVFPTAGRYWKLYVEQEMEAKNNEQAEKIFVRALRNVRNVELWKTYITYIRAGQNDREEVIKAFELALEYIGMDIASTPVWTEYINFAKDERAAATTPFEEGQRMGALRRLYQRAVENPMHDLDNIWREYEAFENALSKTLAKSLLNEHIGRYQHARNVYRERKALLEGILRNMLAKPPRLTDKEAHQVRLWRKLIAYEKTNPQRFDAATLRSRVTATYNQCLLCLYFYPDIWHEVANYQIEVGLLEGATQFYERALSAIPNSLFLSFAYADVLELSKKIDKAKEVYEKLVTLIVIPPVVIPSLNPVSTTATTTQSSPTTTTTTTQVPSPTNTSSSSSSTTPLAATTLSSTTTPSAVPTVPATTTTTTGIIQTPQQPTQTTTIPPLAWIQYMKFSRRHERIEGPRKIFKRAKAMPDCTYHVYIALGFIEYYINQDTKTARDIFELGLKKFSSEMTYVNFYVDFLTNLNEENNTRVLFEKILSTVVPQEKSEPFWRKFMDFEYRQSLDVGSMMKLEKRFQALSPAFERTSILQSLNRYKFLNLWPCHPNEIEIMTKNLLDGGDDDDDQPDDDDDQQQQHHHHHSNQHQSNQHHQKNQNEKGGEREDKPTSATRIPVSNWKAVRPDITQMIPYRNEMGKIQSARGGMTGGIGSGSGGGMGMNNNPNNNPNNSNMGGGDISMNGGIGGGGSSSPNMQIPDFLMQFLQFLPPPSAYNGPWIDADQLMKLIIETPLPGNMMNNNNNGPMNNMNSPNNNQMGGMNPNNNIGGGGGGSGMGMNNTMMMDSNSNNNNNMNINKPQQPTPNIHNNANIPNIKRKADEIEQNNNSSIPSSGGVDNQETTGQMKQQGMPSNLQATNKPPENDIYRKRLASKLSKR